MSTFIHSMMTLTRISCHDQKGPQFSAGCEIWSQAAEF